MNANSQTNRKAEIDWKDLRRQPEKLFGYSYFYFLCFIVLVGYLYISNLTQLGKNSIKPVVLDDSSSFVKDIPLQSERVLPPVDVMKAGVPGPALTAKGKELYEVHCISCHGSNGVGDGPSGGLMNPRPRNFHDLSGWKNGIKVSEIYVTLEEGLPKTGMPPFNYLPPEDRFALIHWIRSFTGGLPDDTPEALKLLDATYKLSDGVSIPGQIPVKKAMEILISENKSDGGKSKWKTESEKGNQLIRDFILDMDRVNAIIINGGERMRRLKEFVACVNADPVGSGFRPSVLRLSAAGWTEIHGFLLSHIE